MCSHSSATPGPCQGERPPCDIYLRFTWIFGWTRSLFYPLGVVVLSGTVAGGRAWGGNDEGNLRCSVFCIIIHPFPCTQSHVLEKGFPACGARGGWLTTPLFVAQSATASVQAHYFMYGVSYCCHPVSCLSDESVVLSQSSSFLQRIES